MTTKRDKAEDRKKTVEAIRAVDAGRPLPVGPSWLGHREGSGAAKMDEALIKGATDKEMREMRGGVRDHLKHLQETHGLPLKCDAQEIWSYDRRALGV